jgi:WD40 repeat protein
MNAAKGQKVCDIESAGAPGTLAFTRDGQSLLVTGTNQARVFNAANGQERFKIGKDSDLRLTAFAPDGQTVVLAGYGPRLGLYDLRNGQERLPGPGGGNLMGMLLSDDNRTLVTQSGFLDSTVRVWDILRNTERAVIGGAGTPTWTIGITPDSKTLLTRTSNTVSAHDLMTGEKKSTISIPIQALGMMAFLSPDGKLLLTSSSADGIRLWNVPALTPRTALKGAEPMPYGATAFTPDGQTVITPDMKGRLHIWNTATGEERRPPIQPTAGPAYWLGMSPDGKFFITRQTDGLVTAWDLSTGKERYAIGTKAPPREIWQIHISPDGKVLVGTGSPGVKLWNAVTGKEIASVKTPGMFGLAAFAPDSKSFVLFDSDNRLLFVDAATGQEIRRIQMPGPSGFVAFAADGRHLVTANTNGTHYVLRLDRPPTALVPERIDQVPFERVKRLERELETARER